MATDEIALAEQLAGESLIAEPDVDRANDQYERRSGNAVPSVLRRMYRTGLLRWQAEAYPSGVVRPEDFELELGHHGEERRALRFLDENQGVCAWFAPLDEGDDPPVLVDFLDGEPPVEYTASLSTFALASSWDRAHIFGDSPLPILQAQAEELDRGALYALRTRWDEQGSTLGWPCETCLRFEDDGAFILLWSGPGQCDWWITAESMGRLTSTVSELLPLSNLRAALWSNDPFGEDLLRQRPTDSG